MDLKVLIHLVNSETYQVELSAAIKKHTFYIFVYP